MAFSLNFKYAVGFENLPNNNPVASAKLNGPRKPSNAATEVVKYPAGLILP